MIWYIFCWLIQCPVYFFPLLCVVRVSLKKCFYWKMRIDKMPCNQRKCNRDHCLDRNLRKMREVPISMISLQFTYFRAIRNLFCIFVCSFWYNSQKSQQQPHTTLLSWDITFYWFLSISDLFLSLNYVFYFLL